MFRIWSQEHQAWWGPNETGYTRDILSAGRYSVMKTAAILERCNLTHREFGHPVNEYAILCSIEFEAIPAEMLEVEGECEEGECEHQRCRTRRFLGD